MKTPRVCVLLLALATAACWAAGAGSLYVGEAPVSSPEPGPSGPPILEALNQVLVRLTGRAGDDLVSKLGIGPEQAESLALARQLRRVEVPEGDGSTRRQRRLSVEFDPIAINRLLDRSEFARWGRERPQMLLWITVDDNGSARYLESDPVIEHAIDQASFRYGLLVTRPILDASDRVEVTPADIRGGFTSVAEAAMRRYGTEGVIMLDLRRNRSFWTGRWTWRLGEREHAFQRSGADPSEVIDLGMGRIAAALASRFAVRPARVELQRVVVSGIDDAAHYVEVIDFLDALTGVEALRPVAAAGDVLTFELRTTTRGLARRIELTGPLVLERRDVATGTLYFRFDW